MTKILILTPQLPYPPQQGTSLRNYNIIRGLLQNYDVTLLSYSDLPESELALGQLSECDEVITVQTPVRGRIARIQKLLLDGRPDMAHRLESTTLIEALQNTLKKARSGTRRARAPFDIVQIEGIELAFVVEYLRASTPDSKIVFDDHNVEYDLQRRAYLTDRADLRRWPAAAYSLVQARRLRRYERSVCNKADHVLAVSDEDRRKLLALDLEVPVSVIPNCIDVGEYKPLDRKTEDIDLIFVGKMDYRPNIDAVLWFADEVWPLIRRERPDANWAIVGQKPNSRIGRLAEQKGISVTGRVDVVQPFLQRSRLCIMPFRIGSGTRLKLIEAMASGRAIVSTSVGVEGFPVTSGDQLLLADEPAAFANAALTLLNDPDMRMQLGDQARHFVQRYDWRAVSPQLKAIYEGILRQRD